MNEENYTCLEDCIVTSEETQDGITITLEPGESRDVNMYCCVDANDGLVYYYYADEFGVVRRCNIGTQEPTTHNSVEQYRIKHEF